ncbi:putative immunity protein [Anaeromassilibacillus senegalensis]|uniref:putative immunity protein n=1 Tax=Anaeromassilibacillus senegalensis TaxID=1673717 RepID=UPI0006824DEB|nr:hypothetical protein [Anaeromassilibacillus senegalensis]
MAKLKKMLGRADDPQIIALMEMIETQNKTTLANWAASYAEAHFLPIYEKAYSEDTRLRELILSVKMYLSGKQTFPAVKALLKQARQIAQEAEASPAAQAAARAVSTACAVVQTPTNALGFVFYGAAASAYSQAGISETPDRYDALASAELDKLVESLQKALIPNDPNPVRITWNC